jgi:hypothetical protein
MKKGPKKTTEKHVTEKLFKKTFSSFEDRFNKFEARFDSSARATAKSFADNAEVVAGMLTQLQNINKITEIMLKEIRTIHEDNKYFRNSISSLNIESSSYDRRIENLTIRVEKLELK